VNTAMAPNLSPTEAQRLMDERSQWAGWWTRRQDSLRWQAGRFLNWLGVPGFIRPIERDDLVTGWHLSIRVGALGVTISVDGRDYSFNRLTGQFNGTGGGTRAMIKAGEAWAKAIRETPDASGVGSCQPKMS